MLSKEELKKQIFQINSFYMKQKLMGPVFSGIINNEIFYYDLEGILQAFVVYNFMKKIRRINIKKLAVRFEFRRMGLGSKLIEHLKTFHSDIQVYVPKHNSESYLWYEKHDFKFVEERSKTSLYLYKHDEF